MKNLLVIILALSSLSSFAQDTIHVKVRGVPGAYNFSKIGDSLIFYVAGVRNALSVGSTVDLSGYTLKSKTASDSISFVNSLNLKANDNNVVHLSGNETLEGTKTFNGRINIGSNGYISTNLGGGVVLKNSIPSAYTGVYADKLFFGDVGDTTKMVITDTVTIQVPINIPSLTTSSGDFITRNSSSGMLGKVTPSQALSDMGGLSSTTASSTYATITALNLKANDNAVMHTTGNESFAGVKTFTDSTSFKNIKTGVINSIATNGGDVRSWQSLGGAGDNYISLKTDATIGKSGIFRSNTDFPFYYSTLDGSTNIVSTVSNQPIIFGRQSTGYNTAITQIGKFDWSGNFYLNFVSDAAGDFLSRNASTGLITRRTASEALSDMGGLSTANAATTYALIKNYPATAIPYGDGTSSIQTNATDFNWVNSTRTLNIGSGTKTSMLNLSDNVMPVKIGNGSIIFKNIWPSGGLARTINQITDSVGNNMLSMGILGNGQTLSYGFLSAGPAGSYNVTNIRLFPDQRVGLSVVNDAAGDFITRDAGTSIITRRTPSEVLSDIGALSSTVAASTYEPKFTKNTAFNKNFGITAGTIMDAQRIIDSLTAINIRLKGKLDSSYYKSFYSQYPFYFPNDTTIALAQSWKDTLAYKIDVIASLALKANINNPVFTGVAKLNSDTLATKADVRANTGGITNFTFLLNRNYANDSLALAAGLSTGDSYQTNGDVKVITRSEFQYTIDNTDGSANAYQLRMDANTGNVKGTIYWGDGQDTVLAPDIYHEVSHTYAAGSSYTVKIVTFPEDNLNKLYLNNNGSNNIKITSIKNIKSLTRLNVFQVERANISIVDTLSFPSTVNFLSFADDPITTFNNLSNLQLTNLVLNGTQLQPNDITLPPTITYLAMGAMQHVGGGSTWNATDVNNFLVRLDAMTFNAGAKTLDITQFNGAVPSGAGLTAKTSLQAKGWTITTD